VSDEGVFRCRAQFTPHTFDADRGGEEWVAEPGEIEAAGKMVASDAPIWQ
jgi:hypothetical protein